MKSAIFLAALSLFVSAAKADPSERRLQLEQAAADRAESITREFERITKLLVPADSFDSAKQPDANVADAPDAVDASPRALRLAQSTSH